jgi:hypothetical protein
MLADDDDDEEDEDYVPEGEEDVEEEYEEDKLSDDPDNPGTTKPGMFLKVALPMCFVRLVAASCTPCSKKKSQTLIELYLSIKVLVPSCISRTR